MKNMKKLLQKAMVFTLSAAMLVGTPMTASAAGLVDLYSISDGTEQIGPGEIPDISHTGTVTNTDTNTNTGILKDNEDVIIGIVLDKDYVNAEKGVQETLKATFITTGEPLKGTLKERDVLQQLAGKIKWEVLYADGNKAQAGVAANEVLSISADAADRTVVTLNPRQGTVKGEEMIVRATVEGRYCLEWNADGERVLKELTTNSTEGYNAEAKVFIKEYTKNLWFDWNKDGKKDANDTAPEVYLKHTIDLSEYLGRDPETANDDITWISSDSKVAAVTAAGVVTFKKADKPFTITAISEQGAKAVWEVKKAEKGIAASKVVILDSNDEPFAKNATTTDLNTDLPGWGTETKTVSALMYAKVKGYGEAPEGARLGDEVETSGRASTKELPEGTLYINEDGIVAEVVVTDVITWTSNKAAVASVEADDSDGDEATITAKGVGKAVITAKASGGKTGKLTVTVKATLGELEITNKETELYTGQSLQMTYDRTPAQSKDAVVWSIAKVGQVDKDGEPVNDKKGEQKMINNPNAKIDKKGVLTISSQLNDNYATITVELKSKQKVVTGLDDAGKTVSDYIYADTKEITLKQSRITGITVTEVGKTAPIATAVIDAKDKVKANVGISKAENTSTLNVFKTGTYNVKVDDNMADTLTWKSSNANIAEITSTGEQVKILAKKNGTATITVSGVYFTKKEKAATMKTTFKVSVQQPVETVTLNKTSVVLNQKDKKNKPQNQTVTFKATLGPKGVNKKTTVHWSVNVPEEKATMAQNGKLTLKEPVVGNEFVVTASVDSGASATATVKIVEKTTDVAIAKSAELKDGEPELYADTEKKKKPVNNTANVDQGASITMYPFVKTTNWNVAGTGNCESVTYSVNKKGIVTIGNDGKVYGIKPGTVKITAKTPTGKKTTLTVTVKVPEAE